MCLIFACKRSGTPAASPEPSESVGDPASSAFGSTESTRDSSKLPSQDPAPDAVVDVGPLEVLWLGWFASGEADLRLSASVMQRARPDVDVCAQRMVAQSGELSGPWIFDVRLGPETTDVSIRSQPSLSGVQPSTAQALPAPAASAHPTRDAETCIQGAFAGDNGRIVDRTGATIPLPPPSTTPAPQPNAPRVGVTLLVRREAAADIHAQSLPRDRDIRVLDDGTCVRTETSPCKPHKDCIAPQQVQMPCVDGAGLPPKPTSPKVDRVVTISPAPALPSDRSIALFRYDDWCSLAVLSSVTDTRSDGAIPCAGFDRVWAAIRRARRSGHVRVRPVPAIEDTEHAGWSVTAVDYSGRGSAKIAAEGVLVPEKDEGARRGGRGAPVGAVGGAVEGERAGAVRGGPLGRR